jgi:hypothetical protein
MDCANGRNRIVGPHRKLVGDLRRGYVRRAPGRLTAMEWDHERRLLTASGRGTRAGDGRLEVWFPERQARIGGRHVGVGLGTRIRSLGPGILLRLEVTGSRWSLRVSPP